MANTNTAPMPGKPNACPIFRAAAQAELDELLDVRRDCDEQEGAAFDVWIAELQAVLAA